MKKFLTLALALVLVIGCVANASAPTIGFSRSARSPTGAPPTPTA